MKLSELLRGVDVVATSGDMSADITSVAADSRLVRKGGLFVAIPGLQQDGAKFIGQALERGAAAVLSGGQAILPVRTGEIARPPHIQVNDPRAALAIVASNFYGRPAEKLSIVGVTGTSGKTTTAKMIESIFDATSEPVGLIGTIEYRAGGERLVADRTTPDAAVLQEWFRKMADAGVRHAVMEVSSHALALKRTLGIHFASAIFTNLSRDHFDFHKDFDDYYAAKRMLFDQIDDKRRTAVVNIDDQYGRRLLSELGGHAAVSFGRAAEAEIRPADNFEVSVRGLHGNVITPAGIVRVESMLLGQPNLYNWLGAIGAALVVGVPIKTIEAGIRNLKAVRGRFERVSINGGPTVIVDYAHKPDALEKLLHALRDLASGKRVVIVIGCGGDRDKGKRPQMGEIAGRLADYTFLTSDNPRNEKPDSIIDEIEKGMSGGAKDRFTRITDRREAIARAIGGASEDDVIVIAGKGHESYQVVGDQVIHFDDREEAELALKKRSEKLSTKIGRN
ncbi:MAG: UDP-N-acetylmuramoyl-L-alanyl-D-glutamate--2,6-diaminopimelate ligase [Thermoanaerobaculia bacterium]